MASISHLVSTAPILKAVAMMKEDQGHPRERDVEPLANKAKDPTELLEEEAKRRKLCLLAAIQSRASFSETAEAENGNGAKINEDEGSQYRRNADDVSLVRSRRALKLVTVKVNRLQTGVDFAKRHSGSHCSRKAKVVILIKILGGSTCHRVWVFAIEVSAVL